ncbi:hypothetical protein DFH29DRAFT_100443 [Suillus ampliporus]|nr:hypothetical protein DFH29DRAFT_100443 [Suillus ampliporus]
MWSWPTTSSNMHIASNASSILAASRRHDSALAQPQICPSPAPPPQIPTPPKTDPYVLLAHHLEQLHASLLTLLGSSHPSLNAIAQYYFIHPSK